MVVAARAMHMAVRFLFFRCVPDAGHFHIKSQGLACQRVVGVHVDIETPDLDD